MAEDFRIEHDTMGEVRVPARALWKAQTQRAVENFPISGVPIDPALIAALGQIKGAAALTNARLGVISEERAAAIVDGVIPSWNAGAERLYGYSSATAIGQSMTTLLPGA